MLNCQLCDFFKTTESKAQNKSKCVCEYTGFVFHKKVEDYEMENHPCFDYQPNTGAVKAQRTIIYNGEGLKLA